MGLAGAGKTSVLRALGHRDAALRAGIRLSRTGRATRALRTLGAWGPAAAALFFAAPGAASGALRHVVRVCALRGALQREEPGRTAVFVDEGPVFSLTRLRALGVHRPPLLLKLEAHQMEAWSAELDGIIWLDACDAVLTQRIRARAKAHRVKYVSDAAVRAFLDGYRRAYWEVLTDLAGHGVRLHSFNTTYASTAEVVTHMLHLIEAARHDR